VVARGSRSSPRTVAYESRRARGVTDFDRIFEFVSDLRTDEAATVERVRRELDRSATGERGAADEHGAAEGERGAADDD
jgi:hypothetical protein